MQFSHREQYVVYDYSAMIADVGGYLGLLLGHSALSLFNMLAVRFDRRNN